MLETLGMNAAGAAVDNTIGLIAGGLQANRQMKNQRKLMAEQLGIDKLKMEEQERYYRQLGEQIKANLERIAVEINKIKSDPLS